MKTLCEPTEEKKKKFAKQQEACRKDMEQAFDVLQSRWVIIRHSARTWSHDTMWDVITACVTMHNIIIDDEYNEDLDEQGW
jgi:hypothetical protein